MVCKQRIVPGVTVVDGCRLGLEEGFSVLGKDKLVLGEGLGNEVACSKFVGAPRGGSFGVGQIPPNLVVTLCKFVATFGDVPAQQLGT